jgi:type II secretory pathway pseudopilin PulG
MEKRVENLKIETSLLNRAKGSFTLFELVIVILIVGIVTFLAVASIPNIEEKSSRIVYLRTLPQFLKDFEERELDFYILGMDCDEAVLISNDDEVTFENELQIPNDLRAYRFNYYGEMRSIRFPDLRIGEVSKRVCLRFQKFRNGSTSSLIVEDENGDTFHLYRPLKDFSETFENLRDAEESLLAERLNPKTL